MGGGGGVGQGAPQAIRTRYSGILFRSRLEARWAVFFDALGVKWEYEKEGYELPSGRYLPDFFLPDWGWVEIKGQEPTGQEQCLLLELVGATQVPGVLLDCSPLSLPDRWHDYNRDGFISAWASPYLPAPRASWDDNVLPCVCTQCRGFGFAYGGRGQLVHDGRGDSGGCVHPEDKSDTHDAAEILRAIATVRGHRFWEPGAVDRRRSRRAPAQPCAGYPVGDAGWSAHDEECPNHRSP